MNHTIKRSLPVYLLCCILAILLISGSLSQLEFKGGQPFPGFQTGIEPSLPEQYTVSEQPVSLLFFQGSLSLLFLAATVYLILLVIRRASLKIIGRTLLAAMGLMGLVYILSLMDLQPIQIKPDSQGIPVAVTGFSDPTSPLQPAPLAWQWVVAVGMLVCMVLLAYLWINKKNEEPTEIDKIAAAAQEAIEAILSADDLRSVILYSYQRMVDALHEQQGIERNQAMTVREFETYLTKQGIPVEPVHHLSLLFESVRYGDTPPSPQDKQLCLDNLQLILDFCQRKT